MLSKVTKIPKESHFQTKLMKVKDTYLNLGSFILKVEKWDSYQILGGPLVTEPIFYVQYPSMYNILRNKSATVASIFGRVPLNVSFLRSLVGDNLLLGQSLVTQNANVKLNEENDMFKWNLTASVQFSIKSMYRALINNVIVFYNKLL